MLNFQPLACFADIDQLITVSGMIIRTSNLIPEMREGEQIFLQPCTFFIVRMLLGSSNFYD